MLYWHSKRHIAAQKTLYEQLLHEHQLQQQQLEQIVLEEDIPAETDFIPQPPPTVADVCE